MKNIEQNKNKTLQTQFLSLILIGVVSFLAYSNTFHVPFQWDGDLFIKENPIVKDLSYFLDIEKAKKFGFYGALKSRYVGYLTFALNYKIGGLNVTGYHIFNFSIHILNALLFYTMVILTFKTPILRENRLNQSAQYIALFAGLLFVAHPVQTEAITYIFQRLASLVAFFYLLSLVAYIKSRQSTGFTAFCFYALSLFAAILAMKTKENAFTLPLVIALYEFLFFVGPVGKRLLRLLPLLLTLCIIPLTLAGINKPTGEIISGIAPATRGYEGLSRSDYLLTQFRVIVTYLRLLILPVNQNIDYDYPIFQSITNAPVFISFLLLLAIFLIAIYLLYRSISHNHSLRLIAFGILWFFITISVESSIVPIRMVIDEYRLYLPSAGIFFAMTTSIFLLLGELNSKKTKLLTVGGLILIAVLTLATYRRNDIWQTNISLWEDTARKSPQKARPHNNLGLHYGKIGRIQDAIRELKTSIRCDPEYAEAHYNLGVIYLKQGRYAEAIQEFNTDIKLRPKHDVAYSNLGVIYSRLGKIEEATIAYKTAINLSPNAVEAMANLGILNAKQGNFDEAYNLLHKALKLKPDSAELHYNLGNVYMNQGRYEEAAREVQISLNLKPDYDKAKKLLQRLQRK